MNLLAFEKSQVVALVNQGFTREENIKHWDICKALADGKTIEQVADDFKCSTRNVEKIKANKCKEC